MKAMQPVTLGVLAGLLLSLACSLRLPAGRGSADGGASEDADVDLEDADADRPDGGRQDGDAEARDGDAADSEVAADAEGADAEGDGDPCAPQEVCTPCSGATCDGACEDEDCDGFSVACPGADLGDERLWVEPTAARVGERLHVRVCSRVHRHGCVGVACEPPGGAPGPLRLAFERAEDADGEVCWFFASEADGGGLDRPGRWICTFTSKVEVTGDCEGGTVLAHLCGVVDVLP